MIPKEIISRAMEGGWHRLNLNLDAYGTEVIYSISEIALDPTFWQALGKALEWRELYMVGQPMWNWYAHRFYDLILTGGDTTMCCKKCETNDIQKAMCMIPSCNCHKGSAEKFWEDILKDNK